MRFILKAVVAFCVLVGLITFVSLKLFNMTVMEALPWVVIGVAAAFGLVLLAALMQLTINRVKLRYGGIDTQWLWFKANPPGFDRVHGAEAQRDAVEGADTASSRSKSG